MPRFSESDEDQDAESQEVESSLVMLRQKTGLIKIMELIQDADRGALIGFFSDWHSTVNLFKWERMETEKEAANKEVLRVRNSAATTLARRVLANYELNLSVCLCSCFRSGTD